MEISVITVVPFPRAAVFGTMRDKLPELIPYLPNVDKVTVLSRQELTETEVKLENLWQAAKTEVPTVARAFIDPAKLTWVDKALWKEQVWECHWDIQVGMMQERVRCLGLTTFEEQGEQTRVHIQGELKLSLKGLLPGLLARSAEPKIESFVVKLIQPNLQKTAEAVGSYLAARR